MIERPTPGPSSALATLLLAACLAVACAGEAPPERSTAETQSGSPDRTPGELAGRFREEVGRKARIALEAGETVVPGRDGWLFFAPELRSLAVGRFWGEAAAGVSRAPEGAADPLPVILDFRDRLAARGVELLFVPVPAKATVYPEKISTVAREAVGPLPRLDVHQREFLEVLRGAGVEVLDLVPRFLAARSGEEGRLYCHQDTHYSGRAAAMTAAAIAERLPEGAWREAARRRSPAGTLTTETRSVTISGDLWRALPPGERPERERLPLTVVGERRGGRLEPVSPWRESPVLLLGDSHNLVFSVGGDLHARGAGLPDHLARELGFPVDLVAVRGSGATPSRVNLLRRGDGVAGKAVVVWVLSVREYTEGQGWREVPLER